MNFVYLLTYFLPGSIPSLGISIFFTYDNFCQTSIELIQLGQECKSSTMDEALGPDGLTGYQNYLQTQRQNGNVGEDHITELI